MTKNLEKLVGGLSVPAVLKDEKLDIIQVSRGFARLCAKSADELIGQRAEAFIAKRAAQKFERREQEVLATGSEVVVDEEIRLRNRTTLRSQTTVSRVSLGRGKKGVLIEMVPQTQSSLKDLELQTAAMNKLPTAIVVRDKDLKYCFANKSFEVMYGKSASEIVGKDAVELFGAEVAAKFDDLNKEVIQTGKGYVVEEELVFPNGKKIISQTEVNRITSTSGEHFACIFVNDVTLLHTQGENLAEKSKELELASATLSALNSAVLIYGSDGTYKLVNDRYCELLGKSREEMIGKTPVQVFGKLGKKYRKNAEEVLASGKTISFEESFKTLDGREIDAMTSIARIEDTNGNFFVCVLLNDVTELKARERELATKVNENSLFKAMIDSAPTSIFAKDKDLNFIYANPEWGRITGVDHKMVTGKNDIELIGEQGRSGMSVATEVVKTGAALETNETIQRPDGSKAQLLVKRARHESQSGDVYLIGVSADISKQIELSEKLEANARKMEALAATGADWFWESDQDHRFTAFSGSLFEITGIAPETIIGKSRKEIGEIITIGDYELDAHLKDLDNHRPFRQFSYQLVKPDGQKIWIEIGGDPQFDKRGNFTGYIGSGRNITDFVESQLALREAQEQALASSLVLKEATEVMVEGMMVFGKEEIEFVSQRAIDLLEVPEEVIAVGQSWEKYLRHVHASGSYGEGEQAQQKLDETISAVREGSPHTVERLTPSGRSILINGQPREKGGIILTVSDVTERTRMEHELRSSKERIEAFAVSNADWFWEMDDQLRFNYFSDGYGTLTGLDISRLIGKTTPETGLDPENEEVLEAYLKKLESREPVREFVYTVDCADGVKRWLSVSATPTFGADGKFIGYMGSGRDVTEAKLRQIELEKARREAQAADRAKSEFLANMSHEIRTPMNGVMGMAELLAKTELNTKQKTFTDIIVKSGASLLTIINDILDFSKIDAGQMELDPAPFTLAEAIEDVATLFSSKVAEKDLEMIMRVEPGLPSRFVGDVGRIRQIVTNLIGNAVKFTESGHILVEATSTGSREDGEGNAVQGLRIAVQDTGIGIPADKCERVFDKFSQVDTSATRKHEGTGLGLAISSSLVELMGGEMRVESVEGEGSTFFFEIELPVDKSGSYKRVVPVDVTGAKILIVDDNPVNRSILNEQMAAWRFDSAAAASGPEAIAIMKAATQHGVTIDAVIMDYQMPGMNGGDTVLHMREDEGMANVPVVMLTSVEETEEGRVFSTLPIQAHLTKPARSSLLLETVIEVIQANQANRFAIVARSEGVEPLANEPALLKSTGEQIDQFDGSERNRSEPVASPSEQISDTKEEAEEYARVSRISSKDVETVDILICEDNEVNQIVFTQILQSMDVRFKIANNGREGLEMYEMYRPAMMLMDVSMPEMNGLEATREIRLRERENGRATPIIGVTAHAIKGDMEKCLEAGMNDYLSKPVSPDALIEKIEKWMNQIEARKNLGSAS